MRFFGTCAALACILVTSACSGDGSFGRKDQGQKLVNECLIETGIPGAYSSPAGQKVPVVSPVENAGGTREGAASINACIRHKAAASGQTVTTQVSGTTSKTTYTYGMPRAAKKRSVFSRPATRRAPVGTSSFCPKYASVLYGGTTYCVGN